MTRSILVIDRHMGLGLALAAASAFATFEPAKDQQVPVMESHVFNREEPALFGGNRHDRRSQQRSKRKKFK